MLRREFLLMVPSVVLMSSGAGAAVGPAPFDAPAFAAAQAAGNPILVQVHADWCPICARQRPVLDALFKLPEFNDLVVFNVDFDSEKPLLRRFDVRMQSTLIAFRGTNERGRLVGETASDKIKALLLATKA